MDFLVGLELEKLARALFPPLDLKDFGKVAPIVALHHHTHAHTLPKGSIDRVTGLALHHHTHAHTLPKGSIDRVPVHGRMHVCVCGGVWGFFGGDRAKFRAPAPIFPHIRGLKKYRVLIE